MVLPFPQPSKGSPVRGGSGLALVKITGVDKTMGCSALEGHKEGTPENLAWAVVKEEEGQVTRSPPLCLLGVSHSGISFPKVSPPANSKRGSRLCALGSVSDGLQTSHGGEWRGGVGCGWGDVVCDTKYLPYWSLTQERLACQPPTLCHCVFVSRSGSWHV